MSANVQDVVFLFGDSITQGAWEENMNGFGQRLSREHFVHDY
jgi:lysophospholipase L1-like esterase